MENWCASEWLILTGFAGSSWLREKIIRDFPKWKEIQRIQQSREILYITEAPYLVDNVATSWSLTQEFERFWWQIQNISVKLDQN